MLNFSQNLGDLLALDHSSFTRFLKGLQYRSRSASAWGRTVKSTESSLGSLPGSGLYQAW
jgi:hypothetical protein